MQESETARTVEQVLDGRRDKSGYGDVTVTAFEDRLDLRIRVVQQDEIVGLLLPGPGSTDPQPWVYAPAVDVADWASMLAIWLDEDLHAGMSHLATEQRNGIRYLIAAPYGLLRSDAGDHERLSGLGIPVSE